jgi:hypothetical protein
MRLLLLLLVLASCSPSSAGANPSPSPPAALASTAPCSASSVHTGSRPPWLEEAGAHNNPDIPYVIATPEIAAGFLFADPLRAGHPVDPSNKILWVVGKPRNGSDLQLSAHPLGASTPVVTDSFPDNSSPGEIYPSIFDVPSPGCWQLELRWAGNVARVDVTYT